jgi:hypothetical protein
MEQVEMFKLWLDGRQRARTDLFFLAHDVLGYDWVNHKVHDEVIDFLPHKPGGVDHMDFEKKAFYGYKPSIPIEEFEPDSTHWYLHLDPRGTLKTTVDTVCDTIQWIINWPDIRVAIVTAVGEQGETAYDEIRKKFQFCNRFRQLFPELCPPAKSAADWGNSEKFTVCNRPRLRKEPTVMLISVGKVIAGYHVDLMKISDVVDINNSGTPGQIQGVIRFIGFCEPIIETFINQRSGWKMIEGTTYDYGDLHQTIRDSEEAKAPADRKWKMLVRSAIKPDGTALWDEKLPITKLKSMETDPTIGAYIVASQYYLNPVPASGALGTREQILFTPHRIIEQLRGRMNIYTTIDLAGMDEDAINRSKNDDTVLNTAGWDSDGRLYVLDIRVGKFTPGQVIDNMFEVYRIYKPLGFKIEKEAHSRVLAPFIRREMEKRNVWLPIIYMKRDNRKSKKQRISGLQSYFSAGKTIYFDDTIQCRAELINQVVRFSQTSTYHDDILDTIVDHCFTEDGNPSIDAVPNAPKGTDDRPGPVRQKFLGFDPHSHEATWSWNSSNTIDSRFYDAITGAL